MMCWRKSILTLIGVCVTASFATISNWTLDNSSSYETTDSLTYSYSSTRDTTISYIYIETGDVASGLDTTTDFLYYTIVIVDNMVTESFKETIGVLPDGDPRDDSFLFAVEDNGLPPSLYHILLTDKDNALSDTFRIVPVSNPYRTVSGTVTAPSGSSSQWIEVVLECEGVWDEYSAFTDENGNYTIQLDQETVLACSGYVDIGPEINIPGYVVEPSLVQTSIKDMSLDNINFSIAEASCSITGTVTDGTNPVEGITVCLMDSTWDDIVNANTDENGIYTIYCNEGNYRLSVDMYDKHKSYMDPSDTTIFIFSGESKDVDIRLYPADAAIFGRVTIDGNAPQGTLPVGAWDSEIGGNWDTTNSEGYFTIPVSSQGTYSVHVQEWDRFDKIPEGYVLDGGMDYHRVTPGDSVYLRYITKPSGGISGIITNNSQYTSERIGIKLYTTNATDLSGYREYTFDVNEVGAYTFEGIPDGTYFAEAGMSIVGGDDPWDWHLHTSYTDENEAPQEIVINGSIVPNIDWEFTDADTGGSYMEPPDSGNGTLDGTIDNISSFTADGYEIMIWSDMPGHSGEDRPIMYLQLPDTAQSFVLNGIPEQSVLVAARMKIATDSSSPQQELFKFISDASGEPRWFDFTGGVTHNVQIEFSDKDTSRHHKMLDGKGSIAGTVMYNGSLPKDSLVVLIWDLEIEDYIYGMRVDPEGTYQFENVPAGRYRIMAIIDTTDDHMPVAAGKSDTIVEITDAEVFTGIDVVVQDRATGTGVIEGTITFPTGTIPQDGVIVVWAVPADTTSPDSQQLNDSDFMFAHRTIINQLGSYSLTNLPDGVYFVVASIEVPDTMKISQEDSSFARGGYGTFIADTTLEIPVRLTPVIVSGNTQSGIDIVLLREGETVNVGLRSEVAPEVFSFSAPRFNAHAGMVSIRFGLPTTEHVSIRIFDMSGRLVETLANKTLRTGYHTIQWRAKHGSANISTGLYVCTIHAGKHSASHPLYFVK